MTAKLEDRLELSDIARNDEIMEMQPFLDNVENPPAERYKNEESQELSDGAKNDDTAEQQPTLKSVTEDTSENLPTIRHEDETITDARKNGNSDSDDSADESKFLEEFEELLSSPKTSGIPLNSKASTETSQKDVNSEIRTEVDSDKSAEVDIAGGSKEEEAGEDVQNKNKGEESSTENASGLRKEKSDDGENDKEESTDVFDDTLESLQKEAPTTGRELGKDLFNLLEEDGKKLTHEVMTAVITRETGKSLKMLFNNLTDQDKSKLKGVLPEEFHRILESITEFETSFHVSYGLNRIFLDERHHPKSGWCKPVRSKDIGIGDDVERLYRIMTIVREISNPVTLSLESYIKLLDIMVEALTRLDPDAEFKEDHKALAKKIASVINPSLTQKTFKSIREYLILW